MPVGRLHQYAANEGPLTAHVWFDRMNGAHLVPEDAVSVIPLRNHPPFTGFAGVFGLKTVPVNTDKASDRISLCWQ